MFVLTMTSARIHFIVRVILLLLVFAVWWLAGAPALF